MNSYLGLIYRDANKMDKAIECLQKALGVRDDFRDFFYLGLILYCGDDKSRKKAIGYLENAKV